MKTTLKTIIAAAALAIAGCDETTGMVYVDYDCAEKNNITVTKFEDNPFTATIEYDYSKIPDFSEKNLIVTLGRSIIPPKVWRSHPANLSDFYTPRQIAIQEKLATLYTLNGEWVIDLKPRPASIKSHVPGKVVIYSVDDMGVYQLEYKK